MHGMEYGVGTSVPAFLAKLWTLVDDGSTDEIIAWDQSGASFHIFDQTRLAKEVLPVYFKHNNMASFVRQLNMYGFRKILQVDHGGMKIENGIMEFAHPFFQKGREHLLDKIKRKVSNPVPAKTDHENFSKDDIHRVLSEVQALKTKTEAVTSHLDGVKRENEALWREVAILRQKHMKQQTVLNKLVQFLVTVVGSRGMPPMKRKLIPIMSAEVSEQGQGPSRGPKVPRQYRTTESPIPYKVEQPRTPATNTSKGVTIQEVFDDPQEYMNVGDFSNPNITFQQAEMSPASTGLVDGSLVTENPSITVKVEDLLDDPTIMENVAQGIRNFSAETENQKKSKVNSPKVTIQEPVGTEPVILNVPDVANISASLSSQQTAATSRPTSQGKKGTVARPLRRKSSGLKVKLPQSSSQTVSQAVSLPANSLPQPDAANQMAMALPTSGLVSEVGDNLDTIGFDLESIKDLLSEGYNIDSNTLLGLFNPEGPVPSTPEYLLNLEETPLKLESGDLAGNELIQYNPSEDLSSIFDLQDIAPVTQTDDDLTEQNLEEELNTPQVTPLAGDSNRLAGDYGKLAKGGKTGLKIKQEMEDID